MPFPVAPLCASFALRRCATLHCQPRPALSTRDRSPSYEDSADAAARSSHACNRVRIRLASTSNCSKLSELHFKQISQNCSMFSNGCYAEMITIVMNASMHAMKQSIKLRS